MRRLLLAAVLAFSASLARAQTRYHVSTGKFGWGVWTFKPIYFDNGSGPHVHSFFASALADATTGDNIVAVWYVRDASAASGWTTKSWETTSRAEAIKSVKVSAGGVAHLASGNR